MTSVERRAEFIASYSDRQEAWDVTHRLVAMLRRKKVRGVLIGVKRVAVAGSEPTYWVVAYVTGRVTGIVIRIGGDSE